MRIIKIILMLILTFTIQGCLSNKNSFNFEETQQKALQEDAPSQYNLGIYYETNKNFSESMKWYEKSASNGFAPAINELGNIYSEGRLGIKPNADKAFLYYEKSSEKGYFDATNNLAYRYDLGLGTKQDRIKAIELYKIAASQGSIRALYNLGASYKYGTGIEKDLVEAYKYFDIARYYTHTSKDMNLKWSIRKEYDELKIILTPSQKHEAEKLANEWIESLKK
ncbi:sel1 repeat family protein [Arcobacter lanthieri]|uniref:tetratricopeptide repeat protein n=1 Tax=Aliarcobacter lanthieri TaxID=1355374 RepID=UPI00192353EA|nr:tetratricopeptide repeat protein [Aliarcobacter lanthieri]MBL3519611.1 sel1 repeat family protein [Aliarcobacter lanthieri]